MIARLLLAYAATMALLLPAMTADAPLGGWAGTPEQVRELNCSQLDRAPVDVEPGGVWDCSGHAKTPAQSGD